MENVGSLHSVLGEDWINEDIIQTVLYDISTALQVLHDKGYGHFDLKPENIFVCENHRFVLGDLGIIQAFAKTKTLRLPIGTPQFVAPEQFRMSKNKIRGTNLTPACDIWSFGAVLYTSIALIPPTFALEFQHRKQYNLNKIYSVDEWIVRHNQVAQFGAFLEFEDMRFEIFTIPGVKTSQSLRSMIKNMLHDNPDLRPTVDNILQDVYLNGFSEKLQNPKGLNLTSILNTQKISQVI